jgi:hypothetical protein
MSQQPKEVLERLLRAHDLGWLIDMHASPDAALSKLLGQLSAVATRYRSRVGVEVSFTPDALTREAVQNPQKVRAFLQALGSTGSPDMLVMVWRILQGMSIREVELSYREQDHFSFGVLVARPGDEARPVERYESNDINDATLLRHFGITTVDRRPLFDGFFPLRFKNGQR